MQITSTMIRRIRKKDESKVEVMKRILIACGMSEFEFGQLFSSTKDMRVLEDTFDHYFEKDVEGDNHSKHERCLWVGFMDYVCKHLSSEIFDDLCKI